ncbi:hypothetical protein KJ359_009254 [Pestalotiopsis sp. 9143b]|nr:hypothetical protein KJ359_009254 [Pestalotiopsis sp. 9143b]
MASTTVRYQMDKDQRQQHSSCWPDNGDIGDATAGENLFDEYVTFDPNDFLRDPQSPSAVLEATDDSVTNSSSNNDQDIFPVLSASSFAEDAALYDFPGSVPEQNISLPAFLSGTDPVLAGESITDSELLRLEGISLKSPSKEDMTAPSSPSLLLQSSPTKGGRFVDSVCSTFRKATGRSRPPRTHRNAATLDVFGTEPVQQSQLPNGNYEYTTDPFDVKPEPIDNNGLPLSPPLTGKIPYSGGSSSYASNAPFVAGNIEDPFCDKIMAPHMGNNLIDTPLDTPALKDDFFFSSVVPNTIDPGSVQPRRPKQRNASSAEWPLDGIISDDHTREWSANNRTLSSYPDKNNALHSPSWWDEPSTPSSHAQQPQGRLFGNGNNTGQHQDAVAGFEHNQSVHHHQAELPYEYTSELSGLMIHMPQPRQPQAAVLTAGNVPEQLLTLSHHHSSSSASIHHTPQHRGRYTDQRQQQQHLRRPQPRAPSSGARHFSHGGNNMHHHQSLTSPRKQPTLHRSGSRSMLVHREESVSPSPGGHHHRPRRVTSSSGLSVRKQRSWSSRAPRTPNPSSSSSHQHHPTSRSHTSSFGGSPKGGGGGGGGVDFVNFTPSDKNLLMTGVAPSGSSKTKARREKEAADRRRRISEAAVKAVQAAGGDVDGLVMDDFGF